MRGVIPLVVALAVLIPWDVCPLGVLLGAPLMAIAAWGLESRAEKLATDLRIPSLRAALSAEVFDVPLIKNEPVSEGDA